MTQSPSPQPTPAPEPDAVAQPGSTPRTMEPERSADSPRRGAAFSIALALLIGFTSVFSAVVAWRASLAAIDSSRLGSLAVQEQARREQIARQLEGIVAQDQYFVLVFQEHALAARELRAQADALPDEQAELADTLDLQAQGRLALARSVQPFFQGAYGVYLDEDGAAAYEPGFVLRNLREGHTELRELRPEATLAQAALADERTIRLIAVAAVLVAALFFLTVAQIVRRRLTLRYGFALAGALLVAAGMVSFVLIELAA